MLKPVHRRSGAGALPHRPAPPALAMEVAPVSGEVDNSLFLSVVAYLFAVLVLLRLLLTDNVLNMFINYSGEGGFILEKIHPATQAMVLLLVVTLAKVRIALTPSEALIARQLLILLAVIAAMVMLVQVLGRSISLGYLIDTYFGACIASFMMFAFPVEKRRMIGTMLVCFVIANSLVSIGEKVTGVRLLPYPFNELVFRPTALTNHPLAVGLFSAGGAVFVLATRWAGWIKVAALLTIIIGTAASGARTGLIFTLGSVVGALILTDVGGRSGEERFSRRFLMFGGMVFGGVLLGGLALAAGFLERFQGGYMDENASARIDVYQVFEWVSWNEILFGADLLEIKAMVMERLKLLIESSVVIFVFQFGLFGAIALAGTIFWTVWRIASASDWRGVIAAAAFSAVAMSNDTLSGKHFHFAVLFLCLIAFRNNAYDHLGPRVRPRWEA